MQKILEKANELGALLKDHTATKRMSVAEMAINADLSLQKKIADFNEKRNSMFELMNKGVEDKTTIDPLNEEIKNLYEEIMANPAMTEYNDAKAKFDEIFSQVNGIMNFYITGESPSGCDTSKCGSCGGGCKG